MKGKAFVLLFLLGVAALTPIAKAETVEDDDDEVDASAFLLVRRKLANDKPEVGKPNEVTVEIYNAGQGDAKSVSVKETEWIPTLFLTEGQLEAEYDTIPSGTSQSFTFTITPKMPAEGVKIPDTLVTYVATEDGTPVTTTSAPKEMYVFSSADILKYKLLGYGSTATMGLLTSEGDYIKVVGVLGVAGALYMLFGMYTAVSKKAADSRRARNLREFGLTEEEMKTK